MTDPREDPAPGSARALREAFDASFAAPARTLRQEGTALLAIRVAGEPFALPVHEIAGLLPARRIVPVPGRRPELVGICGLRGAVVPVYALSRLLGLDDDGEPPRWFVLGAAGPAADRVALAFSTFEGHLVVPAAALDRASAGDAGRHVAAVARLASGARPVLGVASLLQAVTAHETGGRR